MFNCCGNRKYAGEGPRADNRSWWQRMFGGPLDAPEVKPTEVPLKMAPERQPSNKIHGRHASMLSKARTAAVNAEEAIPLQAK